MNKGQGHPTYDAHIGIDRVYTCLNSKFLAHQLTHSNCGTLELQCICVASTIYINMD